MKKIILTIFLAASVIWACEPVGAKIEPLKVAKGRMVKFDYTLKVDGKVFETTKGKKPFEYKHGAGQIIAGLSNSLEGLKVGDTRIVTITPPQAYGEVKKELVKMIPKATFPTDFKISKGMLMKYQEQDGRVVPGIITDIQKDMITVDFNHPLAGKTLEYNIRIVAIK